MDFEQEIRLFEGATTGEFNKMITCGMLATEAWENIGATTINNTDIIQEGTYITNGGTLPIGITTINNTTTLEMYYILLDTETVENFMNVVFEKRVFNKGTSEWTITNVQTIGLHYVDRVQWGFIALDMQYKNVLRGKIVYLNTNGQLVASEDLDADIIRVFNIDDVVVNALLTAETPKGFKAVDDDEFIYITDEYVSDMTIPPQRTNREIKISEIIHPIWNEEETINYMCDKKATDTSADPPTPAPPISPLEQYNLALNVEANKGKYDLRGSSIFYKDDGKYIFGYGDATTPGEVNAQIFCDYGNFGTKTIATQENTGKTIIAKHPPNSSYAFYYIVYYDENNVEIGRTKNFYTSENANVSVQFRDTYQDGGVYQDLAHNICMGLQPASNPRHAGMYETYFLTQYWASTVWNDDETTYGSYQDVLCKDRAIIDGESTAWFLFGEDAIDHIKGDEDDDTEPDEGKDIEDEPIDSASLPSTSALDIGVISVFNPSTQQMQDLTQEMQNQDFLDEIAKYFKNSPLEGIMSCHVVPIDVSTSGSDTPHFGNWTFETTMPKVSEQFYTVNFGSIKLEKKFASFLDFSPYTRVQVYLPYIGYREIDVDDAMGNNIGVKYNFDIITGAILAQVLINDSVHYQFSGSAIMQFPLTSSNHNNLISSIVGLVTSGATTVAGLAVGGLTGGVGTAMAVGGAMSLASSAVHTVASSKPEIQHGGSFAMTNGFLSVKTPYLVVNRPNVKVPDDFAKYSGRMTNKTKFVSECSGYTEFASVDVNSLTALEDEKAEIESILKGGFYA